MANVSIIGAGSWGTALAFLLHENGHQVTEWSAFEKEAESLRTEHRLKTLPDLVLPDDMEFTSDLERAMRRKTFWWWRFLPSMCGRLPGR